MSEPQPRDTHGLAQVFKEHYGRVYNAAYRITGNPTDAEDVLQTVFLRLARRDPSETIDNLSSYLYRAALNTALDVVRARRESVPLEEAEADTAPTSRSSPDDEHRAGEMRAWLRSALARLSPRAAEMFVLRYLEGYDNHDIARMLDTSRAVVAVTLFRTRAQLQKAFHAFAQGRR